jgi:hypothetical protein
MGIGDHAQAVTHRKAGATEIGRRAAGLLEGANGDHRRLDALDHVHHLLGTHRQRGQ